MPPPLPLAPSSSSSASAGTANIRVLVRVRPHNHSELTERGSIGRTNVLNLDGHTKSNQSIDFSGESSNESSSSFSTSATVTVKGIDDNDIGSSNLSFATSTSVINPRRRLTSSGVGYASDGDNGASSSSTLSKQFTFDAVHGPRSTQSEVYESVKGIVDAVVQGYNGTIVCYGQTGSGKTFTMCGGNGSDEAGLIQRSLREIFQKITLSQAEEATGNSNDSHSMSTDSNNSISSTATFHGSFFEIFNERVYDLLSNDSTLLENTSLAVREDAGGVYVEGLKEVQVTNTSEAEDLLNRGLSNRHVASTNMNRTSSRSHAVFVLSIKTEHVMADGLRKVKNSKFTLVDLAGSERQKSTAAYGNRLKEASMINKSLLCLGHVINALVDKEAGRTRHVPFRDSKLTFLLRDTWGGNSKTCLVATVSPSGLALSETISTLKFAQRAKLIKNNAVMNEDTCGTVAALQAEVAKLRSKLEKNVGDDSVEHVDKKKRSTIVDVDVMSAMKRRAEKAERKIAALEKLVSEEKAVSRTLKRKLQGETMARKFKERRLDYLQTKHQSNNDDEQVQLLQNEIATLQQRLEAPSTETVEWRLAYEQAKEELEKVQNSKYSDDVETKKKNDELERAVERLCSEKISLEDRLTQVMNSSDETRKEIDGMIDEVDRLENDTSKLQEQLNEEKSKSKEFASQANEAQTNLERVQAEHSKLFDEKNSLVFEVNVMKTKLHSLQHEMCELEQKLKAKESEIIEVETLSRENELELQCTIEELESAIKETQSGLTSCKESELELKQRLEEAKESVEKVKSDLQEALNKVQDQQSAITGLEGKVNDLTSENNAIKATLKKYEETEVGISSEFDSMKQEIEHLNEERSNLNKRISCVKEQAKITEEALNDKTASLDQCQNQLNDLKGEYAEKIKSAELQKQELEQKVTELQNSIAQLEKSKKNLDLKQKMLDETNASMQLLQDQIHSSEQSQNDLSNAMVEKEKQIRDLEDEKSQMNDAMLEKESEIVRLQESIEAIKNDATHDMEAAKKNLQEIIDGLNSENTLSMSKLQTLEQHLHNTMVEKEAHFTKLKQYEDDMTELKNQNDILKNEKDKLLSDMKMQLSNVELQYEASKQDKEEIQSQLDFLKYNLLNKEGEISKLTEEKRQNKRILGQLKESMTLSKQKHSDQMKKILSEKQTFEAQIETLNQTITAFSAKELDFKQATNDLRKRLDESIEENKMLKEEMNIELKKKDEEKIIDQRELESLLDQRDKELSQMEQEALKMKTECSLLLKQHEDAINSAGKLEMKIQTQQDRTILLQREKKNLKCELDHLREDHDSLNDQVRSLTKANKSLLVENEQLKLDIETMRNENLSTTSISLTKESTYSNDSNLSYDNLTSEMDSMLGRISSKEANDQRENAMDNLPLEDSFDESMFLPNVEDAPAEPIDDKENRGNIQISTPSKKDYGKKRLPLSERKMNMTPLLSYKKLKSTTKKVRSSAKKVRSSAKKDRANYMVFNNRELFGNK